VEAVALVKPQPVAVMAVLAVVEQVQAKVQVCPETELPIQVPAGVALENLTKLEATAAPVWSSLKCQIPLLQPSQVV
jgi:hypothetical protein